MVTPNQLAVLGSMFIDEKCVGPVLSETQAEDFLDPDCRMLYLAVRSLFNEDKPVDPLTVLGTTGKGQDSGLYDLIKRCMEETPTAANIGVYIPLLREESRLHQMQALGLHLAQAKTTAEAGEAISKLQELTVDKPGLKIVTMEQAMLEWFQRYDAKPDYINLGLPDMEGKVFAEHGDFIILAGYPSDGKTALALFMAWHLSQKERVGFFSLETGSKKLHDRLIAQTCLTSLAKIKNRELTAADLAVITERSAAISKAPLEYIEAAHMTASDILATAKARRYKTIFIDYVQLVDPDRESRRENRTNQVSEISRTLHVGAQASGIAVIALSQLTRPEDVTFKDKVTKTVQTVRKAPRKEDLRESGQLEQDADVIMMLYRTDYNNEDSKQRVLAIEKNKEGRLGKIYLDFDGATQNFSWQLESDQDNYRGDDYYQQTTLTELQGSDADSPF